jgi:hypothetical protein
MDGKSLYERMGESGLQRLGRRIYERNEVMKSFGLPILEALLRGSRSKEELLSNYPKAGELDAVRIPNPQMLLRELSLMEIVI